MFGRKLACGAIGLALALSVTTTPSFAAATRTGIVAAKITITFAKAPPSGSTVSCGITLISSDTLSPTDSKFTSVKVSGSTATCNLAVSYRWLVNSASSTMSIAYSASGPDQSSSGIARVITLPPSNTTTHVAVAVSQ
jgi:hypothetical protein